jgi:hypothetical protein
MFQTLSDENKENQQPQQTRDDLKIAAALDIRQQGTQLRDVAQVIEQSARTLGDGNATNRDKEKALVALKRRAEDWLGCFYSK